MGTDQESNTDRLRKTMIQEFFEAAISSEAAFAGVSKHVTEPHELHATRQLVELERGKIAALSALMQRYDLHSDEEAARVRGEGWGALQGQAPSWSEFWTGFIPATEPWLEGMHFLEALSPDDDSAAIATLVSAEEALLEFARRAASGATTDAIAPVIEQLAVGR